MLGISLGQSAVYALLRIVERLTREVPLAQQTSTLNPSVIPDRPWLDLTYQLVGIGFGLMPVFLALLPAQPDQPAGGPGDRAATAAGRGSTSASAHWSRWASACPGWASTSRPGDWR